MITFKELIGDISISDIPIDHQHNLEILLKYANKLRAAYGKPMIITSGYRTIQDHIRIYSQLASRKGIEFDRSKVPMKSRHLFGLACDILDKDGSLYKWAESNEKILEDCGLWCEKDTNGWLHIQCVPYGSYREGKSRFFIP